MKKRGAVGSAADKEIADVITGADQMLAKAISAALREVSDKVAENMAAIGHQAATPALEYFAAVVHQRMYCLMCGADPDTLAGGDPEIAYHVIRNSQNIAVHYWGAEIAVYPAK